MVTRRDLLKGAGALGAGTVLLRSRAAHANHLPLDPARFVAEATPFTLGVASGDPTPDSVVIWTRLTGSDPHDIGGLGGLTASSISVDWAVATDSAMTTIVASGTATAVPATGYSLHVDVTGLSPDTYYWYRFTQAGQNSRIGRTRTAPSGSASNVRFAFISCQDFDGKYVTFSNLAAENLNFVLHLGDTMYELGLDGVRPTTLAGYRNKQAVHRLDPKARDAWAQHPFITTWDDHEVWNDYWGNSSTYDNARRMGYQAYYEHMPIRLPAGTPTDWKDTRVYRSAQFGNLVDLAVLDLRQYRDVQPGGTFPPLDTPGRKMLGAPQKSWLYDLLAQSTAAWKVIGSPHAMTQRSNYADSWDGYRDERWQLLKHIRDTPVHDVVVVSGDWHRSMVSTLVVGSSAAFGISDPAVAVEFNGPGMSSKGTIDEEYPNPDITSAATDPTKPWLKWEELSYRGYVICDVTASTWTSIYKGVKDHDASSSCMTTLATFATAHGASPPSVAKVSGFVPFGC